jgi:hypothetical protein
MSAETFLDGTIKLYKADCLDMLPIMADAIISDPPYGIGYFHSGGGSGKSSTLRGIHTAKAKSRSGKKPFILGDDVPFDPSQNSIIRG